MATGTTVTTIVDTQRRRWRRWLAWASALGIVLLITLYLLRTVLFADMLRRTISENIARLTGCEVTVAKISGSWFGGLTLNEVQISDTRSISVIRLLNCKKIDIRYNLLGLLAGFELSDIESLSIENAELHFDNDHAQNIPTTVETPDSTTQSNDIAHVLSTLLQQELPQLDLTGNIRYSSETHNFASPLNISANDQQASIHCAEVTYNSQKISSQPLIIQRDSRQHWSTHSQALLPGIDIKNGKMFCGDNSISIHIPIHIGKDHLIASMISNSNETNAHILGNFQWQDMPPWIHAIKPGLLPRTGSTHVQAHAYVSAESQDVNCVIDGKELTWRIDDSHNITSSGIIFYNKHNQQQHLQLSHLKIHAPEHTIYIHDPIRINNDNQQRWNISDSTVHIGAGTCTLSGYLSHQESDFTIQWQDIDIGSLATAAGINELTGKSDGKIHISKTMSSPDLEISISMPDMSYQGTEFHFYTVINQDKDGLNIIDLSAQYSDQVIIACSGFWPQRISTQGFEHIHRSDDNDGEIYIDIEVPDMTLIPSLKKICGSGKALFTSALRLVDHKPQLHSTLDIKGVTLLYLENIDQLEFHAHNTLNMTNDTWDFAGTVRQGSNNAIRSSFTMIPQSDIFNPTTWTELFKDPLKTLNGKVHFDSLQFKLKDSLPRIGNLNGEIALTGKNIHFNNIQAQLGYENVHLHGSMQTDFQHILQSDLRLSGKNILLVQSPDFMLRADCDLRLSRENTSSPMRVHGALDVTKCIYSSEFLTTNRHVAQVDSQLQLFALPESFLGNAILDINLRSDQRINIHNKMMRANASADIHIGGTGLVPQPLGVITVHKDARLSLPLSTVWFKESKIIFKEGEPFDPSFNIRGLAKIQGYDLRVYMNGKMSEFTINDIDVIANPPLSQEEATRLLSTGMPPRSINNSGNDIDTSGLVIGWAIIETLRKFFGNGDPRREHFFNSISVEIGRNVSNSGLNTIEVTIPLKNRMYLKVERDKYEYFNSDLIWRFGDK